VPPRAWWSRCMTKGNSTEQMCLLRLRRRQKPVRRSPRCRQSSGAHAFRRRSLWRLLLRRWSRTPQPADRHIFQDTRAPEHPLGDRLPHTWATSLLRSWARSSSSCRSSKARGRLSQEPRGTTASNKPSYEFQKFRPSTIATILLEARNVTLSAPPPLSPSNPSHFHQFDDRRSIRRIAVNLGNFLRHHKFSLFGWGANDRRRSSGRQ